VERNQELMAVASDRYDSTRLTTASVAVVRIGVAALWLQNAAWKSPPDFNSLRHFTEFAVSRPVFGPYAWFTEHVVLPNFALFGWVTLLVEAGLGAFLLVGLVTRFWAVVGVAMSVVITLSALNAPNEWPWSYYLMILVHIALFATAAGRSFGVDGVLRPMWQRSSAPVARLLVRFS
jgi:thiosulfate dehydrogenase [quinone] large subunit